MHDEVIKNRKKIRPLHDTVVVKINPNKDSSTKIVVIRHPVKKKDAISIGKVVAVGRGRYAQNGDLISTTVNVGDIVVIGRFGGTKARIDGQEFVCIEEEKILGIKT